MSRDRGNDPVFCFYSVDKLGKKFLIENLNHLGVWQFQPHHKITSISKFLP